MTDPIEDIIDRLEQRGFRHDAPTGAEDYAWDPLIAGLLVKIVRERWAARAADRAWREGAGPGVWKWNDGLGAPTRGTNGTYEATITQYFGHVLAELALSKTEAITKPFNTLAEAKRWIEAESMTAKPMVMYRNQTDRT